MSINEVQMKEQSKFLCGMDFILSYKDDNSNMSMTII